MVNAEARRPFHRLEKTSSSFPDSQDQALQIASAHVYWQVLDKLGLAARIAQRSILDQEGTLFSDTTQTFFASLRPEISWNLKWRTAMDIRYIKAVQVWRLRWTISKS